MRQARITHCQSNMPQNLSLIHISYELAYLYHKAGKADKCIDACDELILWFGDGPYVERALELNMLYQPLTKAQEEKYRRFKAEKEKPAKIKAVSYTHLSGDVNDIHIRIIKDVINVIIYL